MTLSDRIAAAQGPDRALDAEIAKALGLPSTRKAVRLNYGIVTEPFPFPFYLSSIDAAISTAQPAMQEHIMRDGHEVIGHNPRPFGQAIGVF